MNQINELSPNHIRQQNFLEVKHIMKDRIVDVFYHGEVLQELRRELSEGRKPAVCGTCSQLGGSSVRCLQRTSSEEG